MRTKASLLAQGRLRSVTRLMFTLFFAQSANAELYQWKISIPGNLQPSFHPMRRRASTTSIIHRKTG